MSQKAIEKDFIKNKDDIILVTDYLIKLKYINMSTYSADKGETMYADGERIIIDDSDIYDAIIRLMKQKGSMITKDVNIIYFQRSSNLDFGNGVVYSINGTEPKRERFFTKLVPLSEPNWYYYEDDYNEWRRRDGLR